MNGETEIEKRLRGIETDFAARAAASHVILESVEDHEDRLRRIEELAPLLKINQFIFMALGASVITLIWSILTGQVQIVF